MKMKYPVLSDAYVNRLSRAYMVLPVVCCLLAVAFGAIALKVGQPSMCAMAVFAFSFMAMAVAFRREQLLENAEIAKRLAGAGCDTKKDGSQNQPSEGTR
jgi:hypothetical protein